MDPLIKMTWAPPYFHDPSYPSWPTQSTTIENLKKKNVKKKKEKKNEQSKTKRNKWKTKKKEKKRERWDRDSERRDLERFTLPLMPPPHERETHLAAHITTYLAESQTVDPSLSTINVAYPNRKRPHQHRHGPRETHLATGCLICPAQLHCFSLHSSQAFSLSFPSKPNIIFVNFRI